MLTEIKIFDGHNDVLLALAGSPTPSASQFFSRNTTGHLDYPRALEGGFAGGFFAMFTPTDPSPNRPDLSSRRIELPNGGYQVPLDPSIENSYALQYTVSQLALALQIERESDGKLAIVTDIEALRLNLDLGTLAVVLHIEGAECIDKNFYALEVLYSSGVRSLGVVWSRPNQFGTGVPFCYPSTPDHGPGLTELGKELVKICNKLGIMVDLSHLNEKGFWDIASLSSKPLVATHSCAHRLCPTARNLTDKQIDAIGESNGVIGINFNVADVRQDGQRESATPLEELVKHITYIADRIGIDHVALGSDFDGARMPDDLSDVSKLQNIIECLRSQGYDRVSIQKVAMNNWLRVLNETWS